MYFVGKIQVLSAEPKEYEGRNYFTCCGIADDKEVFFFSAGEKDNPKEGDVYQMILSSNKGTPKVQFQKEK